MQFSQYKTESIATVQTPAKKKYHPSLKHSSSPHLIESLLGPFSFFPGNYSFISIYLYIDIYIFPSAL